MVTGPNEKHYSLPTDLRRGTMTFSSGVKAAKTTNPQKTHKQQQTPSGPPRMDLRAAMAEVDARYQTNHLQNAYDNAQTEGERNFYGKLIKTKNEAEQSGELSAKQMKEIEKLIGQGYSVAQAVKMVEGEPTTRASLVNRMEAQGYTPEEAENMIPEDMDEQIADARAKGVDEVNEQYAGIKDHEGHLFAINDSEKREIIDMN